MDLDQCTPDNLSVPFLARDRASPQQVHNVKRVLITAGASGIGLAIARKFASTGAKVHVCDIDESCLAALGSEPFPISGTLCDVADRRAVEGMMRQAVQVLGGIDVLVNNAGIAGPTGRVDHIDVDQWDRTLSVNITGQFNVTRLAIEHLQKGRDPSIICISSVAGRLPYANRSAYAASKWAVVGFAKTLAVELGALGIRVNAVLPGMVDGARLQSVLEAKARDSDLPREEILRRGLAGVSIKSLVTPDDIAGTVLFLASDAARAISGQALSVDYDAQYMA